MAGVRGIRNPFPSKGGTAKGMFGNKGPKSGSGPNMATKEYAHRNSNDKNGTKTGGLPADSGSARHQKPRTNASTAGAPGTAKTCPL